MTWREMPPPSVFERLAARGTEREFAVRVGRAFPIDPAAVARVRSAVLGEVVAAAPRTVPSRRFSLIVSWQRAASVGIAAAVIAVAGVVMGGARPGVPMVASRPAVERPSQAVVLDRSAAHLKDALATIATSDAATVATMLTALQADFVNIEAALRRPGADLATASTSLRAQAGDLATMGALVPAEDAGLYAEVSGQLDRIIATLPDPAGDGSTHPGGGNGNGNGNGGGNGNGNGKPDGTPGGGNGNPNANPGNNGGGNDKPHPTPKGNGNPHGNGSPHGNGNPANDKANGKPTDR